MSEFQKKLLKKGERDGTPKEKKGGKKEKRIKWWNEERRREGRERKEGTHTLFGLYEIM